jgi:hypothetical protein
MRFFWFIVIVFAVWPSISLGEEAQPAAAQVVSAGEISAWVGELDSELFDARERAQKHLTKSGEAAMEAVGQAARNGSLESSTRALNILLAWSEAEDPRLVVAALEQLASLENRPKEASLAKELLSDVRENLALEEFKKLGGIHQHDQRFHPRAVIMPGVKRIQVIVGHEWKGGIAGLKHLEKTTHVTRISFHSAPLNDEALAILERLPQLEWVELYGAKQMSPAAIADWQKKLPRAEFDIRSSGAFLGVHGKIAAPQALVEKVELGRAAEKAGIKDNDIITKLNGEEVKDFVTLTGLIAQHEPGDTVTLGILRPRPNDLPESMEVKVTFAQWGKGGAGTVGPLNDDPMQNAFPSQEQGNLKLDRR